MKIKEILIASGNKGKLVEIAELLNKVKIKAISAADFNLNEPQENGKTFADNSVIKAKYYGDKTGLISLADDSGLCVDILDNEPGIYSARWAIDEETGEKNFDLAFNRIHQKLIDKKTDFTKPVRAHFICNLTLYNPKTNHLQSFEGRVDGKLTFPSRGNNGFGYDPIFIANGFDKTFGEIFSQEKDRISHRTKAFEQLLEFIN